MRLDELRAALAGGVIAPNTPVWRPGWAGWQPAHEVPELTTSALSAANGVVPNIPPPPLAVVAAQHEFEAQAGGPRMSVGEEPPPPPPYVPLPVKAPSLVPPPAGSSSRSVAPPAPASSNPVLAQAAPSSDPATAAAPVAPSLPTAIGLPPPPELAATIAAAKAAQTAASPGPPPVVPGPSAAGPSKPPPPPGARAKAEPDPMIEELSGSMLLPESAPEIPVPLPSGAPDGLPPPTDPVLHGSEPLLDEPVAGLPGSGGSLNAILDDLRELKAGRQPKNKFLLPVLGLMGISVVIMFLAILVSLVGGKSTTAGPAASASVASGTPPIESAAPTPARTDAVPPPPPATDVATPPPAPAAVTAALSLGDCKVTAQAHALAPRALVGPGIEAVPLESGIAIGFASSARDAVAIRLDPGALSVTATARSRVAGGDARRVTPLLVRGKLAALGDADRRGDRLAGRRIVATTPPIDIGVADGAIAWAPHRKDSWAKVFTLEGEGPVEALRGVPLSGGKGIAVAFRQGGAIWIGTAKGDAVLEGGRLARIDGLGQVGSPSLATSGDTVVVAWADRASKDDEWQIRWTKLTVGSEPAAPKTFALPPGGLGSHAMSPALAGLGGGRFLLAWAEGPVSSHQVRAANIGADGAMSGAPLDVSSPGINAGQPEVEVGADGRGVVAFFAAKGKAFEVHATPIACGAQ